ncbi:MAG TPA: NIL domain-containing protein [bacterium]|nr:NIL domain-containing protein [bacterium]
MPSIKKLVELDYPNELVTEPVLSNMIKKFDVSVNFRRASITKGFGYVQMQIEGEEKEVKKALADLTSQGIDVHPIEKDVLES